MKSRVGDEFSKNTLRLAVTRDSVIEFFKYTDHACHNDSESLRLGVLGSRDRPLLYHANLYKFLGN